ncbi:MAG: PhzF family phenazine biosynthesis protein [Sphingopyxis sp.]|uniref:PhzF family phenazine biosynthesis protein n=1 Tax=Sphingopyxis sp. TaxID=1908224 RepID=UPI001A5CEBA5|nr:PhzF family phenazine biosynthesis protein [Sphingopyxis sp.]MBL9071367.1 PhzF family phenazine biosynthesis protein [Sphingopyxis sp.]
MMTYPFTTVDVFTDERFGGNPLAVVMGGENLDTATMQAVASEFNLSETTFVLPPANPANTARIRIFNCTAEMAFAGHPMVGTAFALASQQPELSHAKFEIPAGIIDVRIDRQSDGQLTSVTIAAPQPLKIGDTFEPELIGRLLSLKPQDVMMASHPPIFVSSGTPYAIAELSHDALRRCMPNLEAFRAAAAAHPEMAGCFPVHVYSREGRTLSARMFAPLAGTWEDPATGSANVPLACFLLSLEPETERANFAIHQGVEMGRPSQLRVEAYRTADGIMATLSGSCVPVLQGHISL